MKSILAVAALLAGLASPALAEDAATPVPTPPAQQAAAPSTDEIVVPAAAPQAEGESDVMTLPAEPSVAKGSGGCAHGKTVYLTN